MWFDGLVLAPEFLGNFECRQTVASGMSEMEVLCCHETGFGFWAISYYILE